MHNLVCFLDNTCHVGSGGQEHYNSHCIIICIHVDLPDWGVVVLFCREERGNSTWVCGQAGHTDSQECAGR